jgi:peroxiredoxin/nitrate/TMAO reductase-like tetraheme cytochrome c subunit
VRIRRGTLALLVAGAAGLLAALSGAGEPLAEERPERARRLGRPLPRFEGRTFDGERRGTDQLVGRRAMIYAFASTDREAADVAKLVGEIAADARKANVQLLGVSRDLDPARGRAFVARHGLEFPVLHDRDLEISRRLRVPPGDSLILLVDAEGWIMGGVSGFDARLDDPIPYYERTLRETLRLARTGGSVAPELGLLPPAPPFRLRSVDGDALESADLEGRVVALVFFLPTCPHCHELLRFLQGQHAALQEAGLSVVAVSVLDRRYVIDSMKKKLGLTFPAYVDPKKRTQKAYAFQVGVPDTVLIDRQGRVFARHYGAGARVEALLTMEVRHLLGVENPILLDREGYSGAEACRICHVAQHDTWSLTNHAYAFDTLAEHGADRNPECLACHTVGFGEPGGYSLEMPYSHLEGIQCETCHGRGGPHQSPGFVAAGYDPVCATCHNPTHSLNFAFADRLPLVSHAANKRFAGLPLAERQKLIERRDRRERKLFTAARFVGSAACQSCHPTEFEKWRDGPHARAFASLQTKADHENEECIACHTTGFEKEGGFPDGGAELTNVGCESCHGPGGDHTPEQAPKKGSILALADKCDSCVILQICGSCHDAANDPEFEFELQDKIDRIRHGLVPVPEEES